MALSTDLISQFAKITKDDKTENNGTTVYGTAVEYNGSIYVKLDGSDRLTPITTTSDIKPGERVMVLVKNHTATVTGNITSPSASSDDLKDTAGKVEDIGNQITEFEIVIADKVSTKELDAERGRIDELVSDNILVKGKITANEGYIKDLEADNVTINGKLTANEAEIESLKTNKLDAEIADIKFATIENLEATDAKIHNLVGDYGEFKDLATDKFTANDATIKRLETEKLSATDADLKYANIDFTNITNAAMENFFANSGLIEDVIIGDGTITGNLVGVTIKGDLIEGGTVVADKLVIKGTDGLYYKLNTDGVKTEAEQTEYNSLNGTNILAKSITATKISVSDLVAFDATIAGFNITEGSLYSGVKSSIDNTTRGIYLDKDGQMNFGDGNQFIKYYREADGQYNLEITAKNIKFSSSSKDVETIINGMPAKLIEQFYQSSSSSSPTEGSWEVTQPDWIPGKYIWRRTYITYGDGTTEYTPSEDGVCITGNTGADGSSGTDSIMLHILSSNGDIFKNSSVSTTLTITIIVGDQMICSSQDMRARFGENAKILWELKLFGEQDFTPLGEDDARLSDDGFILTLSPQDVFTHTVFNCYLNC